MPTPESKVRDPCRAHAKKLGILHQRMSFRPGVKQAFPDDMFLLPGGVPLFVEFKAIGKEPTVLQLERLKVLNDLGYDAIWSDDKDTVCAFLTQAMGATSLYGTRRNLFGRQLSGGFTAQARRQKDLYNAGSVFRAQKRGES